MGKWLIVLPMLFATAAVAAPVWTWVDAQGGRHFSDRPVPGAQEIQVEGAQGFSAPAPAPRQGPPATAQETEGPPGRPYGTFEIVSPVQQETLWNIGATLPVRIDVQPTLQAGHRLDVYLDGTRVLVGQTSPEFTLAEVFRGVHVLEAVIIDSNGRELARTQPVTITVQQTSVLNPNNPNN